MDMPASAKNGIIILAIVVLYIPLDCKPQRAALTTSITKSSVWKQKKWERMMRSKTLCLLRHVLVLSTGTSISVANPKGKTPSPIKLDNCASCFQFAFPVISEDKERMQTQNNELENENKEQRNEINELKRKVKDLTGELEEV
eukprot:scaffold14195_cov155-Skeletonema_dohrnii-CCMP3373.AAC.19